MSKGVRQFALGDNEEDKKKEEACARGWDWHSDYPRYGSGSMFPRTPYHSKDSAPEGTPYKDNYYEYECLKPEQIKITLAISFEEIGSCANPDNAEYDPTNMEREARSLAIRKLRKMNLFDTSRYGIRISSDESLDTIEVSITLTPKKS